MKFTVLGSGSKGNSVYVEHEGTAILIDAGFSGKELSRRLRSRGANLEKVEIICLTHEHSDHILGAGVLSRRLSIPVYANPDTLRAGENKLGKLFNYKEFTTGDCCAIGALEVRSFRISHDTADPVGYVISDGKNFLGYLTDTGKVSHLMLQRLTSCDALILEFNHDLEMLKNGPYPLSLQQRVRSSSGHLCNDDAAAFLRALPQPRLRHLILAHLSEENNSPQLAINTARIALGKETDVTLHLARQDSALPFITL